MGGGSQNPEHGQIRHGRAIAKATIAPRPGDGLVWAKPDGKAMAVALTIGDRPVYLLAAHLPHTDPERVAFLTTVADEVKAATTAHAQTPEGRPWAHATHLWAADLNLTCNPTLDNETRRPAPAPEVARALGHLCQATGGTKDAYRHINPQGRAYTHGSVEKAGSRRRLDAWFAPPSLLEGPTGVVSTRRVDREAAAFSYVDTHTRKEKSKQSDHDAVQITLRGTPIPRPQPRGTLKPSTLRHPEVKAAMRQLYSAARRARTQTQAKLQLQNHKDRRGSGMLRRSTRLRWRPHAKVKPQSPGPRTSLSQRSRSHPHLRSASSHGRRLRRPSPTTAGHGRDSTRSGAHGTAGHRGQRYCLLEGSSQQRAHAVGASGA